MFFEGKARSRRGDLLALRGKGAVPPCGETRTSEPRARLGGGRW